MKYLALLRGINVGGKNIIKMEVLKSILEKSGFEKVVTFIQSGNVVFESTETDKGKINKKMEKTLTKFLGSEIRVVIKSEDELKKIIEEAPKEWSERNDIRCYIAFIREPVTAEEVAEEIKLKEGIDFLEIGPGAVYMTTLLSGLTKSGFTKLVGSKVYKDLTIRNFTTVKKILMLLTKGKN